MQRLKLLGWLLLAFFAGLLFTLLRPTFFKEAPTNFTLRLLHTNDHHAHLEPVKVEQRELGGITRRQTLVQQLRGESTANKEPLLLLSAGDIFQGTLYFNFYRGLADLDFYNAMGYNAATIGNHEFDKGQQPLAKFIEGAKFPIISANIQTAATSPLSGKIKPSVVLTVNKEKIGIFGLTTEETAELANPGEGIVFTDAIASAKKAVQDLTAQGINKIIALTHIGFKDDLELARQVSGIDVIVGGHSHTPLGNMIGATEPYPVVEKTPDGSTVLVVTDWEWGKYLGDLHVEFDRAGKVVSWTGSPHPVEASIAPDAAFQKKLDRYAVKVKALQQKAIGKSDVMLNGERDSLRSSETNLGNLIADATLAKTRSSKTQIAILNSGGIRGSISVGQVTQGRVVEVLPFNNTIARLDLTGAQIKQALEHGVSNVEEGGGQFPQVGGLRFAWNPEAPVGSRVINIQVRDNQGNYKPLNPNATYRVATNSYMMTGGDGYSVFTQGKNQVDTGLLQADALGEYINENSPIKQQVEGRIVKGIKPFS